MAAAKTVQPSADLSEDDAVKLAAVLRALAHPARLQILSLINAAPGAESNVSELRPFFTMSQPALSKHLAVLLDVQIVLCDKRRSWHWYRLNLPVISELVKQLPG
ncbi:hypothetical protein Rhe02_09480 [Rhizocola hellebori]|uniref:HTH arsR-type domain-containing protein n=1 Tax=Rhizocola hellebori TaxID=1392758 RepID=A0A8J3Q3B5_9ACTN|nr:metalloregulator ArsR/SmtB family transcription factor [Rhizocola hellebori]GIH02881.1 hypothetical protein Rhe02_09480 [Rhizocola hellebori]